MSKQKNLNPSRILALSTGYWDSHTLLTANRMGVFALLADKSMTVEQIAGYSCQGNPHVS